MKVVPASASDWTLTVPPCAWTICCTMYSPSPSPALRPLSSGTPRWKASNNRGVDARILVGRRHRQAGAHLGDVAGQVLEKLRHVIEQDGAIEVAGGAHLAHRRFPLGEDVLPPLAEKVREPSAHVG